MALLTLLFVGVSGCQEQSEPLHADYGRMQATQLYPHAGESVNGTGVLAHMFNQAGHDVYSLQRFGRQLEKTDCIVWFRPDDAPRDFLSDISVARPLAADEELEAIEQWLDREPGRTVIFVGRGYDAELAYWRKYPDVLLLGTKDYDWAQDEAQERHDTKEEAFEYQYLDRLAKEPKECSWYSIGALPKTDGSSNSGSSRKSDRSSDPSTDSDPDELFVEVEKLEGVDRWTDAVDPAAAEIVLYDRMELADGAELLLGCDQGMLVSRKAVKQGQVIVVANGSFLLNLPLVNLEHRKLAGQLIAEIGPTGQKVCFLEAQEIHKTDEEEESGERPLPGIQLLRTWPTCWIFLQFLLLGIILVFWRLPIFGRPREPVVDSTSDFDKHIDAFADMLEKSDNPGFAKEKLRQFRNMTEEMDRRGRR